MDIVTDCAADLPAHESQALGVTVVPLYICLPRVRWTRALCRPDEFYNRLEAMQPDIPSTSQPSAARVHPNL